MRAERVHAWLERLQVVTTVTIAALVFIAVGAGCTRTPPAGPHEEGAPRDDAASPVSRSLEAGSSIHAVDAGCAGLRTEATVAVRADVQSSSEYPEDGDDDPTSPGEGRIPGAGPSVHFERVGLAPMALTRICDLTPFADALYAAHAHRPLGTDGATITRWQPLDDASAPRAPSRSEFRVAFDWNRPGEPTKGGGAGQGFLRVHAIGGRLFVPDADPPYNGLGLADYGTEGYVFVSDRTGTFPPPRAPHFRPPAAPDLADWQNGRGGAAVLPRAYHVIDTIRYRGSLFASTGSVPPKERAWSGPSPGALHRADETGARWNYEVDYPYPWQNGVWRLTFMVRFRGRLYAGIQDYDRREPNDYVVFEAPPTPAAPARDVGSTETTDGGAPSSLAEGVRLGRESRRAVRITSNGTAETLRWWVDTAVTPHRLYWIAWAREGIALRVTTDGERWAQVALPADSGPPTDVTRFRDAVVVLTARGLHRLEGTAVDGRGGITDDELRTGIAEARATLVTGVDEISSKAPATSARGKKIEAPKSPFDVDDFFCVAPLAVFRNRLYAGGQRGGALYRLTE